MLNIEKISKIEFTPTIIDLFFGNQKEYCNLYNFDSSEIYIRTKTKGFGDDMYVEFTLSYGLTKCLLLHIQSCGIINLFELEYTKIKKLYKGLNIIGLSNCCELVNFLTNIK
jgi:hypothetical protein